MNANNLKPYLPFGSMQFPRQLTRIRNAWVALVTAPNQLSIDLFDTWGDNIEKYQEIQCNVITSCGKCKDKVECSEELKKYD